MTTKKEFVAIAEIMRHYNDKIDSDVFDAMIKDFAWHYHKSNPRFDDSRFFEACRKPI